MEYTFPRSSVGKLNGPLKAKNETQDGQWKRAVDSDDQWVGPIIMIHKHKFHISVDSLYHGISLVLFRTRNDVPVREQKMYVKRTWNAGKSFIEIGNNLNSWRRNGTYRIQIKFYWSMFNTNDAWKIETEKIYLHVRVKLLTIFCTLFFRLCLTCGQCPVAG